MVEDIQLKKMNIILDETTVLNFPFIGKLIRRYWFVSLIIPLVALIFGVVKYSSQNTIFQTSHAFKNTAESASSSSAFASILGEKNRGLDETEIVAIANSIDFQFKLAEVLMEDQGFSNLNFNSINAEKPVPQSSFFAHCGSEKECVRRTVATLLPSLYSVVPDKGIINRYLVIVRSLDAFTSKSLLKALSILIESDRVKTIQSTITQQIKLSEELIETKRKELEEGDINTQRDRYKFLVSELEDLDRKLNSIRHNFFVMKQNLSQAETILEQTLKVRKKGVNVNELLKGEKAAALELRISQLREDLNSLEISKGQFGGKDQVIITQIKEEIKDKQKQLDAIGAFKRSISSVSDFVKSKDKTSPNQEFDYVVLKKRFDEMKNEYDNMVSNRENMVKEMTQLENHLDKYKPTIEFLKLLEQKSVQLKIAESTVVSDLSFDTLPSDVASFKKTSLGKILFISLASGIFFMFVAVLSRYFMDGRIYDEYELQSVFKDLEIIGNTPDFQ